MESILFDVRGTMHLPRKIIKMVADDISKNEELYLEADPTNKYDANAVKVYYFEDFIGYVEAESAEEISQKLQANIDYDCKVFDVDSDCDYSESDRGRIVNVTVMAEVTFKE